MISPAAKNPASWQAVDILRLDNQTANVSSCLALLFNRHLLISFALSCLFAGLLAYSSALSYRHRPSRDIKKTATHPLFFLFVSNLLEFLLPVHFLLTMVLVLKLFVFTKQF